MKTRLHLTLSCLLLSLFLSACGGGSNKKSATETSTGSTTESTTDAKAENTAPIQGNIFGPLSTGSVSEPEFVYFDLDSQAVVELTTEQAGQNSDWDIAFKRSGIYLNQHSDNTVLAYAMSNNSDFFDDAGNAIAERFIYATAETELDEYLAVTAADIPTDESVFVGDINQDIIADFYHYNFETHVLTAADENYFIVNSADSFTKFRVTEIVTAGRGIGQITLQLAYQGANDVGFANEQAVTLDASSSCAADVSAIYLDFESQQEVNEEGDWDISLPCKTDKSGAEFKINIAANNRAIQDFDNHYTAMDLAAVNYYGFKKNNYAVKAFDSTPWYQYGLNGGHLLWSQYTVYLIKTAITTHKLQITSYYNEQGVSGNFSIRADKIDELAGIASE